MKMTNRLVGPALLALALWMSGCTTNMVTDLSGVRIITPLSALPPNDGIRCSTSTVLHEDTSNNIGLQLRWDTGKVFAGHFIGGERAPASIEIVASSLNQSLKDLGFTGAFSYSAEVLLRTRNGEHRLSARAERNVHGFESVDKSVKFVVESVVADLATQAADITKK